MRTFTDTKSRVWSLDLNLGTIRRLLKTPVGNPPQIVDLLQPQQTQADGQPLMTRLAMDFWLFVDCLYVLVEPPQGSTMVSDEEFASGLGGETLTAAADAFWSELVDFFRKAGRPEVVQAIETQRKLIVRATTESQAVIAESEAEATKLLLAEVQKVRSEIRGRLSTDTPAASASAPASSTA